MTGILLVLHFTIIAGHSALSLKVVYKTHNSLHDGESYECTFLETFFIVIRGG